MSETKEEMERKLKRLEERLDDMHRHPRDWGSPVEYGHFEASLEISIDGLKERLGLPNHHLNHLDITEPHRSLPHF